MATDNPDIKNTISNVPGNGKGTLAGLIAATATGFLTQTPAFASVSAWLISHETVANGLSFALTMMGIPVATAQPAAILSIAASAAVFAIVNYGVTHFSGLKKCQEYYNMLPNTYAEYPNTRTPIGTSTTNLKTKTGDKANRNSTRV